MRASDSWGLVTKAAVAPVTSIFGNASKPARHGWGPAHEPFAGAWQRGAMSPDGIDEITAVSAVYACLTLISGDISKLNLLVMQRRRDNTKAPATDSSPFWRPLVQPNAYETRNQFLTRWVLSKLIWGNAYVLLERDGRGMVQRMHVLDPRRVTPLVTPDGGVYYSVNANDLSMPREGWFDGQLVHFDRQKHNVLPSSEVIHDRCAPMWHPLIGVPPLYAAAMSATQARRIQANSSQFFENMSRPGGFITVPGEISEQAAVDVKRTWERGFGGANVGRLAILTQGMKFEPATSIPAEQAQLIDQLKWTAIDIAGAFLVPGYKINVGAMPTVNSVGGLNQQYYDTTLQTHIEAIESLLTRALDVASDMCVEFDLEGLLRMDPGAQIEMLTKASGGAVMTPNDARSKINLRPITGGDALYKQHQDYSIEALAKRDAKPDPFDSGTGTEGGGGVKALVLGNGKSVDRYEVEAIVREMLDALPKPQDGRDAFELDVRRGIDCFRRYHAGEVVAYRGGLIRSYRQTDPVPPEFDGSLEDLGWHVIQNGIDDLVVETSEDFRRITIKMIKTDGQAITKSVNVPVVLDRGVYRDGTLYEKGDGVTWGGSFWIAQMDCRYTKPGESGEGEAKAWRLSIKSGRDGRDGNKGDKGDRGAEGRAGRDLTQMTFDGRKF